MPRADDDASVGYRLSGVYERLLAEQCEDLAGPDPRLNSVMPAEEWERMKEQGAGDAAAMLERRLAAGLPLVVERWRLGGHSIPVSAEVPFLNDRSVKWLHVGADDVVAPSAGPRPTKW